MPEINFDKKRYELKETILSTDPNSKNEVKKQINKKWYSANIPKKELKQLSKRNDRDGLKNFGLWFVLLIGTGSLGYLFWGAWLTIPIFFIYGTLYTSSDARWHELAHKTPFKTLWINKILYHICSFMTIREAYFWRWSHRRHHTNTLIVGEDREITGQTPINLFHLLIGIFYLTGGRAELKRTRQRI